MDLLEKQKARRKRGFLVLGLAAICLASAIMTMTAHQIPAVVFVIIYTGGFSFGVAWGIIGASYKMEREISASKS